MHDNYKNIEEYNANRKGKILNVFDDMNADMLSNRILNSTVNESFSGGSKLNLFLVFIIISYFAVPKNIRLNSTHYCLINIPNKQEFQQSEFNHSKEF